MDIFLPALSVEATCLAALAVLATGCDTRNPGAPEFAEARALPSPAGVNSGEPHLGVTPTGKALLSWVERMDDGHVLRYSILDGDVWSRPREVARGNDWFVNWADFPSVEAWDESRLSAHWLVKRPGGVYAYDIFVAHSDDAGRTWHEPFVPHHDGTATEHGFVSLFQSGDGIGGVWLDGREMKGDESVASDSTHEAMRHGSTDGPMTLRAGMFGSDALTSGDLVVDERVCDCCQTDAAAVKDGVVVVYRDRTEDEVRDISLVRFDGRAWSKPVAVATDGWRIDGCPVNGPAVAAHGDRLAVAWYTAADGAGRVRVALSGDGGRTFAAPVNVDAGAPLGRVDLALINNGAVVSWLEQATSGAAEIRLRIVTRAGAMGPQHVLATTSPARSTGFPQMVSSGDRLVLAWTDASEPSQVKTAALPFADGP